MNRMRYYFRKIENKVYPLYRLLYRQLSSLMQQKPEIKETMNPKKPLFIPTYDGGNQSMHPKMIYFSRPWNGYKFWYVTTPYKGWNDYIENPCM